MIEFVAHLIFLVVAQVLIVVAGAILFYEKAETLRSALEKFPRLNSVLERRTAAPFCC